MQHLSCFGAQEIWGRIDCADDTPEQEPDRSTTCRQPAGIRGRPACDQGIEAQQVTNRESPSTGVDSDALKCRIIRILSLKGNGFGEAGAIAIAELLQVRTGSYLLMAKPLLFSYISVTRVSLTELDLGHNDISLNSKEEASLRSTALLLTTPLLRQEGIEAIALAIKSNQRVAILSLAHNYIKVRETQLND